LERNLKVLLPKESNVRVLVKELLGCTFDGVHVVGDTLHGTIQLELVSNFDQVVTGWLVNSWDLDGLEVSSDHVDDISDTVFARVAADRWLKLDNTILELNLDIENGGKIVCLVV
jgi:hypothetical protein